MPVFSGVLNAIVGAQDSDGTWREGREIRKIFIWKECSRSKLIAATLLSAMDEMLSDCNLGPVSFWGSAVKGIHDSSSSLVGGLGSATFTSPFAHVALH